MIVQNYVIINSLRRWIHRRDLEAPEDSRVPLQVSKLEILDKVKASLMLCVVCRMFLV
ncbi:unnamed protein product [Brassica oleracea]